MKIGLDYWQVCSHYPDYFRELAKHMLLTGSEVHIISAIGATRIGTIEKQVRKLDIPFTAVHEVVFDDPKQSPKLKLGKCKELGITVFYDDRDDVCRLLNYKGILAMRVTRKDNSTYDLDAEQK